MKRTRACVKGRCTQVDEAMENRSSSQEDEAGEKQRSSEGEEPVVIQ